jgi:uncharacterized membrane protein YhhN
VAGGAHARDVQPTREYPRSIRIALPLISAFACLLAASRLDVPILGFVLFIVAMGLVFDAGTLLFARVTGTGGIRDNRQ